MFTDFKNNVSFSAFGVSVVLSSFNSWLLLSSSVACQSTGNRALFPESAGRCRKNEASG